MLGFELIIQFVSGLVSDSCGCYMFTGVVLILFLVCMSFFWVSVAHGLRVGFVLVFLWIVVGGVVMLLCERI